MSTDSDVADAVYAAPEDLSANTKNSEVAVVSAVEENYVIIHDGVSTVSSVGAVRRVNMVYAAYGAMSVGEPIDAPINETSTGVSSAPEIGSVPMVVSMYNVSHVAGSGFVRTVSGRASVKIVPRLIYVNMENRRTNVLYVFPCSHVFMIDCA